jgi:RNA polymerase sigma factor (TIGR02999 family)
VETVTQLLSSIRSGESDAAARLYAVLYPEIKRLARSRLFEVGGIPNLGTTALVNEGFLRIAEREGIEGATREQFFAYTGKVLRSVVLDWLRARAAEKRGGDAVHVTLSGADDVALPEAPGEWAALDEALAQLERIDPALYALVELRYFAGFRIEEIAAMRGVTTRTVDRDWARARTLLEEMLGPGRG